MKHLSKFNESFVRSYSEKEYSDFKIEEIWNIDESYIVELFSDVIDEFEITSKVKFILIRGNKVMDIKRDKMDPERIEAYVESGIYKPAFILELEFDSKINHKDIMSSVMETIPSIEEYRPVDFKAHMSSNPRTMFITFEKGENDLDYHKIPSVAIKSLMSDFEKAGYHIVVNKLYKNEETVDYFPISRDKNDKKVYSIIARKSRPLRGREALDEICNLSSVLKNAYGKIKDMNGISDADYSFDIDNNYIKGSKSDKSSLSFMIYATEE